MSDVALQLFEESQRPILLETFLELNEHEWHEHIERAYQEQQARE